MQRSGWSCAVLGLMAFAGILAIVPPSARAQMCTPAIEDCESEADAEALKCALRCERFDTICADRCDDTHDTVVRYCRIKASLCKASEGDRALLKASDGRK